METTTSYTQYTYSVLKHTYAGIENEFNWIDPAAPYVLITRFSNEDGSESDVFATSYTNATEARTQLLTHASYYDYVHGERCNFAGEVSLMVVGVGNEYLPIPVIAPVAEVAAPAQKITNTHRADVLRTTWQLVRKSGLSFGKALRKAWAAIRAKIQLATTDERGIWIEFMKIDGSIRRVLATRNPAHIPADKQPKQSEKTTNCVAYFDIWNNAWKCFRADSLLKIG